MALAQDPEHTTLRIERTLAAPREKVFRAWTEPQELKKWFAPDDAFKTPEAEVDLRIGGRYRVVMVSPDGETYTVSGVYKEIKAPEKLVFTWAWASWPEAQETLVTVEFRERDGKTEIVLTHERFPSVEIKDKHGEGWAGCLRRLPKVV